MPDENDETQTHGSERLIFMSATAAAKRGRGRPNKLDKLGTPAELQKQRSAFVATYPVVLANPPPAHLNSEADRQNLLKHTMAVEVANLTFTRQLHDQIGDDTAQASSRIINVLKQISAIGLEVKKLGNVVVDPRSAEVQQMFEVWTSKLTDVLSEMASEEVIDAPAMDLFFTKFSKAMEGWEDTISGDIKK